MSRYCTAWMAVIALSFVSIAFSSYHADHSVETVGDDGVAGHVHDHDEEEFSCGCCHSHEDDEFEAQHASSVAEVGQAFLHNALEACPWLLVGLTVTVILQELVEVVLPPEAVRQFLSLSSATQGGSVSKYALVRLCFLATFLGLVTPLCSCGAIPLALALGSAGCEPAAVVSFLTAAQSAGLDTVAITLGILGWPTALFRLFGSAAIAMASGLAVGHLSDSGQNTEDVSSTKSSPRKPRTWASRAKKVYSLLNEVWVVLVIGVLATTIAEDQLGAEDLLSSNAWFGDSVAGDLVTRLCVVFGSLPFQLCEHGVVSFAKALQQSGATPGLAQAFLLCAPATNIATLGAVLRSTGNNASAALRSAVALAMVALALSYIVDGWLSQTLSLASDDHIDSFIQLPQWWASVSVYICAGMLAVSLFTNRTKVLTYLTFGALGVSVLSSIF